MSRLWEDDEREEEQPYLKRGEACAIGEPLEVEDYHCQGAASCYLEPQREVTHGLLHTAENAVGRCQSPCVHGEK